MSKRRRARELSLRVLYAFELSQNPISDVISKLLKKRGEDDHIYDFCKELIEKTNSHKDEFNDMIRKKALNWEFDRIAVIDRIILRMAMCELLYFDDIPPKVSIDEAIEISKKYSTENSGKFINGILDSVLFEWRKTKKLHKKGRGLVDSSKKK